MASGQSLVFLSPLSHKPPATNFPTPSRRGSVDVLNFDDTVNESTVFLSTLPNHYGGGGLTIKMSVMAVSDVLNNYSFSLQLASLASTVDRDLLAFASGVTVTAAANIAAGVPTILTFVFASGAAMANIVAGDNFALKVLNLASTTSTIVLDTQLESIALTET